VYKFQGEYDKGHQKFSIGGLGLNKYVLQIPGDTLNPLGARALRTNLGRHSGRFVVKARGRNLLIVDLHGN
jgi:hypothetical protein